MVEFSPPRELSRVFRVGISGSYGGLNLGDEAILRSIVAQLRRSLPAVEITVFSRDPDDTLAQHRVERSVAVRKLSRKEVLPELERLDLFILGGGGILFDAEAEIYLREVRAAVKLGVPVMTYAVGAGPLEDRKARALVSDSLKGPAEVTVREQEARKILQEAGVEREIRVTADPALLLEPESLAEETFRREGLDTGRALVGLSVREPGPAAPDLNPAHYLALVANVADYIVDRFGADVVFVPMERRQLDLQHAHATVAQMAHPERATVLKGEYTPGQMLSLVQRFQFCIGMRLHFLIFAAVSRVPFVALPYAGKVSGFLRDLDMDAPPVQQVNAGNLIAHIDRAWNRQSDIRARIEAALPGLHARARETNRIAVRLLTHGSTSMAEEEPEVVA